MEEVSELLSKWNIAQQELAEAEMKCEKYRDYVEKLMDAKNTDSLISPKFTAVRHEVARETVSKKMLPVEVWNKYARRHVYSVIQLKTMVNGKLRSPRRRSKRSKGRSRARRV